MLETNAIIDEMNARKVDLDNAIRDIESQQNELDIRRSRIEGKISEIGDLIRRIKEMQKENTGVKPIIAKSSGPEYIGL